MRRLAGEDPAVNEEWNCDKGRWAFTYATQPDRLTTPLVRDENGVLVPASWPHALAVAADGLLAARDADPAAQPARGVGVLTGGRLTLEDAYAYAKFARVAAGHQRHRHAGPPALGRGGAVPGRVRGRARHRRQLRRPGAGPGRAAGRLRAGGRVAHRLPAAAQGGQASWPAGVLGRGAGQSRPGQAVRRAARHAARRRGQGADRARGGRRPAVRPVAAVDRGPGPDGPGRTSGGAVAAGRAGARRAGRGDPGRRAAGRGAGRAGGRGHARGRVGGAAGLGAPPGGRARGRRGRGAARAAAHRPPGDRPGGARRGGPGLGQGLAARPPRGAIPRPSWPRRPTASSAPWWWRASTRPTCRTRRPRCARSRWPRSWSASSCGPARSPTAPTWCSRSRPWRRRPARS